jgi:hypothetical protein
MITQLLDVTSDFNANSFYNLDVSGWDYVVLQLVTPTGTVTFNTTNDGGAITGAVDGNARSAKNWNLCFGTNIATGVGASTIAASSMFRFSYIGKYFQITGTAITATAVFITLNKIQ